jgi:hypothetical protein
VPEKYTLLEDAGTRDYLNWFQHYDVADLTAEVEAAGLTVIAVHGDVAGAPFEAGAPELFVAVRRPGAEPGWAESGRAEPGRAEPGRSAPDGPDREGPNRPTR